MLHKYSKIIAVSSFLINIFLAGLDRGFSFQFAKFGLFHGFMAGIDYFTICFFLLLILAGLSLKNKLAENLVCLPSLILILNQYKYIYFSISGLSDEAEPFVSLFRESIPLNLISFSLIVVLLVIQIITVFQGLPINKQPQ